MAFLQVVYQTRGPGGMPRGEFHDLFSRSTGTCALQSHTDSASLEAFAATRDRERLTGILIGLGTSYIGILEGPEASVLHCLEQLATDPRNSGVIVTHEAHVRSRRFAGFDMHEVIADNEDSPLNVAAHLLVTKLTDGLRRAS